MVIYAFYFQEGWVVFILTWFRRRTHRNFARWCPVALPEVGAELHSHVLDLCYDMILACQY